MKLSKVIFQNHRNCSLSELQSTQTTSSQHSKAIHSISMTGYATVVLAFVCGKFPAREASSLCDFWKMTSWDFTAFEQTFVFWMCLTWSTIANLCPHMIIMIFGGMCLTWSTIVYLCPNRINFDAHCITNNWIQNFHKGSTPRYMYKIYTYNNVMKLSCSEVEDCVTFTLWYLFHKREQSLWSVNIPLLCIPRGEISTRRCMNHPHSLDVINLTGGPQRFPTTIANQNAVLPRQYCYHPPTRNTTPPNPTIPGEFCPSRHGGVPLPWPCVRCGP